MDGNETWLTRLFAAAMARRSNEAIRRASASTKPSSSEFGKRPVDVSVPFRGVAVEVARAENDFERATAADQIWEAFGAAATGMHAHPNFGLAESRVFARCETHVTGEDELAAAAHTATDLRDTDHRRVCETHECIQQNWQTGRPDGCHDVPYLAGQIKVGEIEWESRSRTRRRADSDWRPSEEADPGGRQRSSRPEY